MRIDLHTHTTASDGTDPPAALGRLAKAAGLDVVALTDHDSVGGWEPARAALPEGVTLVPGAELSCGWRGVSLHLLAYLFDPDHPAMVDQLAAARAGREPRARAMVERLAAAGYPISWEAVLAQVGQEGGAVGRPHLADALVTAGAVADREAAFAGPLSSSGPFFVRQAAADPLAAVGAVLAAGGVVAFAHPRATRRGTVVPDALIAELAAAGLAALEVDHRDHDLDERAHLRGLAGELGLLVLGSSDYHGAGKANRLGEHTTDPEAYAALLDRARGPVLPVVA